MSNVDSGRCAKRFTRSTLERLEPGGEVPEHGGLFEEAIAGDVVPPLPDLENGLDNVVDVTLGVDSARNGQAHQLHWSRCFLAVVVWTPKHDGANLHSPDARFAIEFGHQGLAGELERGNV